VPYFIGADCLDVQDRTCIEECPVDCIYEGGRKMYINPDECIDCGACEPVCPVSAIVSDLRIKDSDAPWRDDNARFFTETLPGRAAPLGSPGGAVTVGVLGVDTPLASTAPRSAA
jgi:NAD-dependent dihydropyrimidine dehydrogenase PreA subunit